MTQKLPAAQFKFNSGEISPRLYGRPDIDKYASGLETATNVICLPHGPIIKRNGSQYVGTTETGNVRLIRFQKSVGDNFIIELGVTYMRFLTGGSSPDYVEVTSGTADGTTATHLIDSTNTFSTVSVGARVYNRTDLTSALVTAVASGDLTLDADIFVSGESYYITPELVTTYAHGDLFDIEYAQFGDDMYLVHSDYTPARLHRYSTDSFLLEDITFSPSATVEGGEFPVATVTPAATTGNTIAFTASADSFRTNDVGRQIIHRDATTDQLLGKGIIVAYTSPTVVDVDITTDFASTSAIPSGDWKIDLSPNSTVTPSATGTNLGDTVTLTTVANTWKATAQVTHVGRYVHIQNGIVRIDTVTSDLVCEGEVVKAMDAVTATDVWTLQEEAWSAARGYPGSVGFFEERLWLGGTTEQPQNLWGSVSGDFLNFGVGADDSDALDLLISDSIASPISWISSGRDFIVGGAGGEFTISSSGGFITPSDRSIRLRSTHGSSAQQVDRIDNEVIFVDTSSTSIRAIRYDFDSDSYISDDLLFFNDHLPKAPNLVTGVTKITQIAVAQRPNNLIYAVLNNGDMIVGQFNRQQQVLGWERFQTDGKYKSVATITVGDHDEVWVIVQRLINGVQTRFIERFDEFDDNNGLSPKDGFLDSFGNFGTPISITNITQHGTEITTGNPDSVTAYKLVDSTADFVTDAIVVGDIVNNTTTGATTYVTAVDDLNTLSLFNDIFSSVAEPLETYTVVKATILTLPSGHGLVADDSIVIYDALYIAGTGNRQLMTEINTKTYFIGAVTATTAVLRNTDALAEGWNAYSSNGVVYKKVTAVSGLDHLEGKTVTVKVDNAASTTYTVASGAITLATAGGVIQYGLPYTATIKTLKLPDNGKVAIAGQTVRFVNPILRLFQSVLPTLNTQIEPIRDSSMLMNVAPGLFTGDVTYGQIGWEDNGQLEISDSSPFPIMINAVFGTVEIGEI